MNYSLYFYVPESHTDHVKNALFNAGAGKIGHYDHCCWQTKGEGQFRALTNSSPFIGQKGQIETVTEYKVEMICEEAYISQAIDALKKAHPYEEPAYGIVELKEL